MWKCDQFAHKLVLHFFLAETEREGKRDQPYGRLVRFFSRTFLHLESLIWFCGSDSRKPAEVMQNHKVLCPFEPNSSILEAREWISTRHSHITPMGSCRQSWDLTVSAWTATKFKQPNGETDAHGEGEERVLREILELTPPAWKPCWNLGILESSYSFCCVRVCTGWGRGRIPFSSPGSSGAGPEGCGGDSRTAHSVLWRQKRVYQNPSPQQHWATYHYSNARNKEIEVLRTLELKTKQNKTETAVQGYAEQLLKSIPWSVNFKKCASLPETEPSAMGVGWRK